MFILKFLFLFTFAMFISTNHLSENVRIYDPPCYFNPLCVCSKAYPDLGRVTCKNIPLQNIPTEINASKVFALHLEDNGIRDIVPHFFSQTGLFRIEISRNLLGEINEEAFTGLERSLWELKLPYNRLKKVPTQSLRYLRKLKILDLSGNDITNIQQEDWLGLENSVRVLILSDNELSSLRPGAFSTLQELEVLDLSENALFEFDGSAFKEGAKKLNKLNLADNLLSVIPFQQFSELRNLSHLDLSFNHITEIQDLETDTHKKKPNILSLETLKLDYNKLQYLSAESFKYFPQLKKIYLNGNPIVHIENHAFKNSKIREIYLKDCEIFELKDDSFSGLENHLEILDLENNNLTGIPLNFFKDFDLLTTLDLKNNYFKEIDFDNLFDGDQPSLEHLDFSGQQNIAFDLHNLERLHNIRSLSVSKLIQPTLSPQDFPEILTSLEEIKISFSNLKNLKSHAFRNVRGLRRLDLSENSISTIEEEVFSEIGSSLVYLSLANGLSFGISQLPVKIFKDLGAVEFLDISNNRLKVLPQKLFHQMKRLRIIRIQDNFIELIPKSSFQGNIHSELKTIQLSFNQLSSIETQNFENLNKLEYLWLNDNRITKIEKRAFVNLEKLKYLYLRGNKIKILKEESFQNLPELEKLDLAYNDLRDFNYNSFERVGTLSSFTLNISHNSIKELTVNLSAAEYLNFAAMHINIKALDISHNNISVIGQQFFRPIESSVTHLYVSHNRLSNVTHNVFGNMKHLQWLDLSNNFISYLEYDCFSNTKSIQVLYLSQNRLQEIPKQLLKGFTRLRILDLSNNHLRSIPDNLFDDVIIEKLDVSENELTRFPTESFDVDSAEILSELDLSENEIMSLPSPDILAKFKNLYYLNLSKNRLIRIEDETFSYLNRLKVLDLSHNIDLILKSNGHIFYGLDDTLEDLILRNVSLHVVPPLHFSSLLTLDLSNNNISSIPFEFSQNLSQLQKIELEKNNFTSIPPAINALPKLQYLGISGNPLKTVKFQQSYSITELDMRNVSLDVLEKGALGKMPLLETFKFTINENNQDLNLPHFLKDNYGLKNLFIEVVEVEKFSLGNDLSGSFSTKLQNLTIVGSDLKTIPKNLLQNVRSPRLNIEIHNTSVMEISNDLFENTRRLKNISINVKFNKLKTIGSPMTNDFRSSEQHILLKDIEIEGNDWICDCSIGWIEGWERKKRQYLCEDNAEECYLVSDDLRSAVCSNRKPNTLIDVLKTELECGWNSSGSSNSSILLKVFIFLKITLIFYNL